MIRFTFSTFATLALMLAAFGLCSAEEPAPAKHSVVPIELAVVGEEKLARLELRAEVGGVPVSAIWDDTFAKLFAYFDRDNDGLLDAKEAARLPSPRALRQAMGNGFTPPTGAAPTFAELDRNNDGKVTPGELASHYLANGVGNVQIGIGRLPASPELTAAILKSLDTDGDSKVSEKEWKAAPEVLKKLDKNDDELIGAGELVPKALYPGAAGTLLLAPPAAEAAPEAIRKFPLVLLPTDPDDTHWTKEISRRNAKSKAAELPAWRKQEPTARWTIAFTDKPSAERFAFVGEKLRVDGWIAGGKMNEVRDSARKQIEAQLDAPPEPGEAQASRRAAGGLTWLVPVADRDGDDKLDRKELDAWFDLQAQIARGQVLLTVLDGGGLFELLDTNHDGALSIRELHNAWSRLQGAGCLTAGAFDAKKLPRVLLVAASRGYPRTLAPETSPGPAWFRAMDRNGDGDVSRREFTGPPDVFDKLDLDKDGLLSTVEAEKAPKTK